MVGVEWRSRLVQKGVAPAAALILILLSPWLVFAQVEKAGTPRKASFAGSFYPSDGRTLEATIDGYLKAAQRREKVPGPVFGLVVPHAGYQYSGPVAAFAYNQVKGVPYRTVILLGSSHRVRFRGVAVETAEAWESPLGKVTVNQEMARALAARCSSVRTYAPAFQQEHSLEVQLPFLQTVLRDFTILPLITGSMDDEDLRALSEALSALIRQNPGEILLVASSDLSHYHSYEPAGIMDRLTLAEIESLNAGQLVEDVKRGKAELCGLEAALTIMSVARSLNGKGRLLRYANSGDETGDRGRVVGYGSMAFSYPGTSHELSKKQQTALLEIARKTVEALVSAKPLPKSDTGDPKLAEKRGVFVTLTKKGALRGCIGYIRPYQPLYKAVSEMAAAAASQDSRFRPVSKDEIKDIRIEISVLSPLKPIASPQEVEVGTHGLYIMKGGHSGLLLPQVAVEQKWNREEFLGNTCVKAGLPPLSWKEKGTAIYAFTAQIFAE